MLAAPVSQPLHGLAERDHADEDQADDEHAGDDVAALLGGVGEQREHGASLTHSPGVGRERAFDGRRVCGVVA